MLVCASGQGTLQIFIDEMDRPAVALPIDLDYTLDLADGRAWTGFTAATGSLTNYHLIDALSVEGFVCDD